MAIRTATILIAAALLTGCPPPPGVYHTVREGQTLYRIGKIYKVDEEDLIRYNGIDDPTRLQVGQRLFVPGATRPREVPSVASVSAPKPVPPSREKPAAKPDRPAVVAKSPAPASPAPKPSRSAASKAIRGAFDWPVQGKVVKKFSARAETPSKGIEIAVPQGSAVHSAAAGRVIYSGDGIDGYGNLIILKHDDSFFTVYGFNRRNLVDTGTFVGKKERIALSGTPPDGGIPRLHFEIRRGKQAVDPIFYLP